MEIFRFLLFFELLSDPGFAATCAPIASCCDSSRVSRPSRKDRNAEPATGKKSREGEREKQTRCFLAGRRRSKKKKPASSHLAVRLDKVDAASRVDLQARELAGLRPVGWLGVVKEEKEARER